jgi:hypothetical protein
VRRCENLLSIVSDYRLDDRGSIPGRGKRIFPLASVSRPALRPTQPSFQWYRGSFLGGKAWPGWEAYHSHTSSVEVNNEQELCLSWRLHGVYGTALPRFYFLTSKVTKQKLIVLDLHLLSTLKVCGNIPTRYHTSSWRSA